MLIIGLFFNSCGLFLQQTGMKNYSLKEKIENKNFNKYQYDFIYLTRLLEKGFPNIESVFPEKKRIDLKKEIIRNLASDNLENIDFLIQMRKYLSNFHNQHTSIYLKSEYKSFYPFVAHISYNKWYMQNISKQNDSSNIGKRILKLNDINIATIENNLIKYTFAENRINQQYELRSWGLYNNPKLLKEIGIIENLNAKLKITFSDNSSIFLDPISTENQNDFYKINYLTDNITRKLNQTHTYKIYANQNFGYLQFNRCHDKIDILEGIESYVKPWLQPIARGYVKRQFKKEKPSKQIAPYYNLEYPVFKDFVWELVDSLNTNNIKNLIIDLRNNPGGNLTLGVQLMYFLTNKTNLIGFSRYAYTSDIFKSYFPSEYKELEVLYPNGVPKNKLVLTDETNGLFDKILDEKSNYFIPKNRPVFNGNVYIISNYRTGSAAAMLTTLFQDNGLATIIGTSVGNNAIGATTYTPFKLPKTKSNISIATTYQERPKKNEGNIQIPDYWIEYSINDLITGKDPYLEKIKELINNTSRQ